MQFMPMLKDFLSRTGLIYTVRSYRQPKKTVVVVDGVPYLREFVGGVSNREPLVFYVEYSGFPSTEEWWSKILQFIPTGRGYLYKVHSIGCRRRLL